MKRVVCKLGEIPFNYNKISNGKVLHFITFISILLDAKLLGNMLKVETKPANLKNMYWIHNYIETKAYIEPKYY